jgi:hypothetical protein
MKAVEGVFELINRCLFISLSCLFISRILALEHLHPFHVIVTHIHSLVCCLSLLICRQNTPPPIHSLPSIPSTHTSIHLSIHRIDGIIVVYSFQFMYVRTVEHSRHFSFAPYRLRSYRILITFVSLSRLILNNLSDSDSQFFFYCTLRSGV